MPNVKITELPVLPVVADADLLAGVDDTDTTTKKLTALQLKTYVLTGGSSPASTVVSETAFGGSPFVGTSLLYARQDHTHGSPPNPLPAHVSAVDPHTVYLLADGTRALSGNLSAGNNRLTTLGAPVAADDAATKGYVDSLIVGSASGQNTAALSSGLAGYVSGVAAWSSARANGSRAEATVQGVWSGVAGIVPLLGVVHGVKFTTEGGQPQNGSEVYLAADVDDTGTALGKLTAAQPQTGWAVVVGVCVDNSNYAALKECVIILNPKSPIQLT